MSKTRSDAILSGLPEDKQEAIEAAVRPLSLRQGVALLAGEWDIVVSKTTLSDWLNERAARREAQATRDRIQKSLMQARHITSDLAGGAADEIDNAAMLGFSEWALDQGIKGNDPTAAIEVMKVILKGRELRQKERSHSLDEQKFQRETCALFLKWFADKRATDIANGAGNNDAKIAAMRGLFFAPGELPAT